MESMILGIKKQRSIYVFECDGEFKIGYSTNVQSRLKAVQTSRSKPVTLLWQCVRSDATKIEKFLHRKFYEHHLGGEWFDSANLDLEDIKSACSAFPVIDWNLC